MKIIYCLCDASQSGGTERVVVLKANYLAEVLGYDVRIVTTGQKQKTPYYDISEKIECFDLDINYSELDKYTDLVKLKKQVQKRKLHHYRLRDYLLKEKADIVISTHSHEFTILPKIEDGSKKIGEIHFSKESNWIENKTNKQSLFSKLFSLLANKRKEYFVKKYDKFVVLTKADLENWKAYSNVCHLYNPLSFYPVSHSGLHVKRVLGVGRLSLEKRFHLLIQAWSKVSEDFPDWTLDIFGTGKEKESLEDLIRSYKLEKTVCVNPPVKNIQQEYLNSSIYVMSSRYEGFGMVLVEAMACGVPCVSFDCPIGPSEIITDGEDGFLVENGNVKALADKMRLLMADENLRISMGKKARVNIKRFSQQKIMSQWDALFHEIVDK